MSNNHMTINYFLIPVQSHELAVQFSSGTLQPSEDLTSENLFSTTEQCLYLLITIR